MTTTRPLLLAFLGLLLASPVTHARGREPLPTPAPTPAPSLELVKDGRARVSLVLGSAPTPDERAAAAELRGYLQRATGARLPVASGRAATGPRILLGASMAPPEVRERLAALGVDGYLLHSLPDGSLVVAGNAHDGTSFAVYDLLERAAGIRWLWPGPLGEVVPRQRSLTVPPLALSRKPAFVWRDLGPRGALWGPMDKWQAERKLGISAAHQRTQALWEKRNRFGGVRIHGGHAFGALVPPSKYGKSHPEYFALTGGKREACAADFNGKHRHQLCTSNPEVVRIVADQAKAFFRQHPEYEAFSIAPNDGRGFCECDRCRALDSGEMDVEFDPESQETKKFPVISDRMVTFANAVAKRLVEEHPEKKVIIYAYGQYRLPPRRTKVHPNVIIQYTQQTFRQVSTASRQKARDDLSGWAKHADHRAIYEYFTQGAFPDLPRLYPQLIADAVRQWQGLGYRYFQTQHGNGYATNGFNFYLLGRALWDPAVKWEDVLADYTRSGFGPGGPAVERYLRRLADRWLALEGQVDASTRALATYQRVVEAYPRDFLTACRQDLEEAKRLTTGQDRARVAFVEQGLRYVELTVAAAEATIPVARADWKGGPEATRALAAWDERERQVASLEEEFVIPYMWVRYNDRFRSFNARDFLRGGKRGGKEKILK